MAVSSSSDITPAELPEGENECSGQAVLEIANGGSIYIKPCQQSSEPFCQLPVHSHWNLPAPVYPQHNPQSTLLHWGKPSSSTSAGPPSSTEGKATHHSLFNIPLKLVHSMCRVFAVVSGEQQKVQLLSSRA